MRTVASRTIIIFSISGMLGLFADSALAAQLQISDCGGVPRVAREVRDGTSQQLLISVADYEGRQLDGIAVVLKNAATSAEIRSRTALGSAAFEDLESGDWRYCIEHSVETVSEVRLVATSADESEPEQLAALGAVAGSAAALGIVIGGGSGSGSSGSDSTTERGIAAVSNGDTEPAAPAAVIRPDTSSPSNRRTTINEEECELVDDSTPAASGFY